MKTIIMFLAGLFLTSACISQTVDCKKFKNGKFYYPGIPNKLSVRKDSIQESYDNGKLEMVWRVKWLSDCQYEITCTKVLVNPFPIKVGDRIVATIIKTDGDCYTASIVFYNAEHPEGQAIPGGQMCMQK